MEIRQAVALVRDDGRTFADVAQELVRPRSDRALLDAVLAPLSGEQKRILAALAVFGDASLDLERLSELTGMWDVEHALAALERRHLVDSHSPRYSLAGALPDQLQAVWDLHAETEQALAYFIAWAEGNRRRPSAQLEEDVALMRLLRAAAARERFDEAIRLGRAVASAFAWGRRWGSWREILEIVFDAARRIGHRASEAWALHELGTQAFCMGAKGMGVDELQEALEIRREIGDEAGAAATRHNLGVILGPPPLLGRLPTSPFLMLAILVSALVVAGGGVGAWLLSRPGDGGGGGGGATPVALSVEKTGTGQGTVTSSPAGIDCGAVCTANFEQGDEVALTAKREGASRFVGWEGGGCTGTSACEVTLTKALSVRAVFRATATWRLAVRTEGDGAGTVTSNPRGIACGKRCAFDFPRSITVTLTSEAARGSIFKGWSGDCRKDETKNDCVVMLDAVKRISASFEVAEEKRRLTLKLAGEGGGEVTSDPPGIRCGSDCVQDFPKDAKVALTATANEGAEFAGWSGGGCAGTGRCDVTLDVARKVTATFSRAETVKLSVKKTGSGSGTVTSAPSGIACGETCEAPFAKGTPVTLTASVASGGVFGGWRGGGCRGTGTCTVTMDATRRVTAIFNPPPILWTLTISKAGDGSGTVASRDREIQCGEDCSADYADGTQVTLTATPTDDVQYFFGGWKGGVCQGTGTCTVTMDAAKSVTAIFRRA
ncbi:MAG: hypothetical protein M3295_03295 [Chloroflexota bacterium]|nr:hypothetical protein [Chloroflexota bacterium]